MPTLYRAREHEETAIPISAVLRGGNVDIFPEVQKGKYFEIRFRRGKLVITAGKYVGLVPLNEETIVYVEPKVPLGNLIHLLAVAGGIKVIEKERQYKLTTPTVPAMLEAFAAAFVGYLEDIEIEGLYKTYINVHEASSSIKGQIRFQDSLQQFWSRGKRHFASSSYFDLTSDVPGNQLLCYACHTLIMHFRALKAECDVLSKLGHFEQLFFRAGVSLRWPSSREIQEYYLSPAYLRAAKLANALLSKKGIELPLGGTDVYLPSFLIDMEELFEEYIFHVLRSRLTDFSTVSGSREGVGTLFDDVDTPAANPDIVILDATTPVMIGDAKYKSKYSREDLNQVLAYALSYRVRKVVLFLPAQDGAAAGIHAVGRVQDVQVLEYRIRLDLNDLQREADALAAAVAATITARTVGLCSAQAVQGTRQVRA